MPWDFGMNKVDQIEMILSEFYFKTSKQVSFVNKAINIDYSLSHLHAFLTNLNTIYHILYTLYIILYIIYIIVYCVLYIIHTPMRLSSGVGGVFFGRVFLSKMRELIFGRQSRI